MATEIVTQYPLPPWLDRADFQLTPVIETRLAGIEDRLSRIERMISEGRDAPKE